jgi:Domain of unknown function (DUF222)
MRTPFELDLADIDADQALELAERVDCAADRAEAARLQVALRWADLHGCLDEAAPAARSRCLPGAERLVPLGGRGTPKVAEFAPAELAAVWRMSHGACAALVGDALDLRHRLPRLWAQVLSGRLRPWQARKLAQATRHASQDAAAHADRRLALWAHSKSLGQLLDIAEHALVEADPQAADQRARDAEQTQGVWLSRSTDHGLRDVFIRTDPVSAAWLDASLDRIADGLGALGDTETKDHRRAKAVGVLAQPQQALDLFDQVQAAADGQPTPDRPRRQADPRPDAVLYVHLDQTTLTGQPGAASVEDVGAVVARQAREWLGRCQVTIRPVLDLNDQKPVDAHKPPDAMRDAVLLRSPLDCFPWALSTSRRRDLDHTVAYVPIDQGGEPGQTRTDNLAPLGRRSHRVKTHGRWRVRQIDDGVLLWTTPRGRHYLVDPHGTHTVVKIDAASTRSRAPTMTAALN